MRVYFSLTRGSETIPDGEGFDADDLSVVLLEVMEILADLRRESSEEAARWHMHQARLKLVKRLAGRL